MQAIAAATATLVIRTRFTFVLILSSLAASRHAPVDSVLHDLPRRETEYRTRFPTCPTDLRAASRKRRSIFRTRFRDAPLVAAAPPTSKSGCEQTDDRIRLRPRRVRSGQT